MKIGISGPISTEALKDHLDLKDELFPKGLGGSPVNALINALLDAGHDISVYSLSPEIVSPVVLKGSKLMIYYGPYRHRHKMRDLMKGETGFIRDFIVQDNPDLVHAHWSYEFALGALLSSKPTLITFHDWAPHILYLNTDLYRLGRLAMDYITIIKGRNFSVVSPYLKQYLKNYVRKDIPVIPNGISEKLFSNDDSTRENIIISVNNGFDRIKNVRTLISAFQVMRKELPMYSLHLVGTGFEEGGTAQKWAITKNVEKGVVFRGPLSYEMVMSEIRRSKLMIHPSREEACSMVLIEAMASRTPIIGGFKSGAVPWELANGKAGILTNIMSPAKIKDRAVEILRNSRLWNYYSEGGYKYAKEQFVISKVADQYFKEYKRILDDKRYQTATYS